MIQLTHEPIDAATLITQASQPAAGAVVLFLGITREFTDGRQTVGLDYEAYEPMARQQMTVLEETARQKWPLVECQLVHRLGQVPLAEASVAIVVSSPHRKDAFDAGEWLIDTLKEVVPIWKRESWSDGTSCWIHPGVSGTA